jgi:hypothetical protein
MDGKPLPHASVIFIPENGRPAGARTDEGGNYTLNFSGGRKGAIPGKSMIRITTVREAEHDENGKVVMPGSDEKVPAKFNTNTTLEFTVEPNKKNVANFDITSS